MADDARVFWLSGSYHLRFGAFKQIRQAVGEHEIHIYDDNISGEYLEHQVLNSDLFGGKKVILLKTIPEYKGSPATSTKRIKALLEKVPEDCVVIISGVNRKPALQKHVKKIGKVIESPQHLPRSQAISWVKAQLDRHKKTISDEDLGIFIEYVGEEYKKGVNMDRLILSTMKFVYFLGKKRKATTEDILSVSDDNQEFVIWKLFDALDQKKYKESLSILHKLRMSEKSDKDVAYKIMNMVLWRYRVIFFLKECLRKGDSNEQALEKAKSIKKISRSGSDRYMKFEYDKTTDGNVKSTYSDGVLRNMVMGFYGASPAVEMYSAKDIYSIISSVYEIMYKMRVSCNEIEYVTLVENFFMTVCGILPKYELQNMRRAYDG